MVRTGLIHFKYLCAAESARTSIGADGYDELVEQASGQLAVHTAALQAGQRGGVSLVENELTFWYKTWRTYVEERGSVVGSKLTELAATLGGL